MKMKRVILSILMFTMAISLFACEDRLENQSELNNPPTLEISSGDETIDAKMGTSSWTIIDNSGDNVTINSDSEGPVELVKDMLELEVAPNSSLELNFSSEPDKVRVNIWEDDKELKQVVNNMEITSPDKEGLVVYEVIGEWEQGTVYYAFSVEVE